MPDLLPVSFGFGDGINREKKSQDSDIHTFWNLKGFRHSMQEFGVLEQTPNWVNLYDFPRGTYYNAGSKTEPANSAVCLSIPTAPLYVTQYVAHPNSNNQVKIFRQTTVPAGATIYTGLRLVINSVASLSINLGSTLDVEMTATAAFRWRKNGGGWTAGVPAVSGVSIDSGNATLYFLAVTGYAGTEAWSWTRTDASADVGHEGEISSQLKSVFYKGNLYFSDISHRIMIARTDNSSVTYILTVGYRPVYGTSLCFYGDHLVVGRYSATYVGLSVLPQAKTIGWSDKFDVENFIPTDLNEADSYTFPNNTELDSVFGSATIGVQNVFVVRGSLFALNGVETYITTDLGLPNVFDFIKFSAPLCWDALIAGDSAYVIARDGIYSFDGVSYTLVSQQLGRFLDNTQLSQSVTQTAFFTPRYNNFAKELVLYDALSKKLFVYQERFKTWYSREVDFPTTATSIGIADTYPNLIIGCGSLKVHFEDVQFGALGVAPVFDSAGGTVYSTPIITTQLYGRTLATIKECKSSWIGAKVTTSDANYYTTGTGIQVKVSWYQSTDGFISGNPSTDSNMIWTSASTDGNLPGPLIPFRLLAFEITVVGTASKPPQFVQLTEFSAFIRDPNSPDIDR